MTAIESYNIEVTLPNNKKRTILYKHNPTISKLKSTTKKDNEKKDYNALVNEHELSRYLYQELQSDNINPGTHRFYYFNSQYAPLPPNQSYSRRSRIMQVKLFADKPSKVSCTSYKGVYTSQSSEAAKTSNCCCNLGYSAPKLGPNETAFHLASINRLGYMAILALVTGSLSCIIMIEAIFWSDNLSETGQDIFVGPYAIVSTAVMLGLFYLSICIPTGRGWLIIDKIDKNDPEQDVVYIKTGYCCDRFWSKKHVLDMGKFRGIRIESDRPNIEDDTGGKFVLVFDGDEEERKDNVCEESVYCGPRSCGDKSWVFRLRSEQNRRVYYEIARFFKDRYGGQDGYNLRFSIPRKMREELRNYGVKDELLNGNGAWKDKECVELQIADEEEQDIALIQDGVDDLEIMKEEIRDLIEFVTTEVGNDIIVGKESGMIENVLNDDMKIEELIESYKEFKKQYLLMYENMESLYVVKLEYSKRILTLLAFKANGMITEEYAIANKQDGAYTIPTKIDGNDNCNDGLKDSLLLKIN